MSTDHPRPIERILIATGLTPESVGGVLVAKWLTSALGAKLSAAHIIEPVSRAMEKAVPGVAEANEKIAREELEVFAHAHGLTDDVELKVICGSPAQEIVNLRHDLGSDLLVIGRYGKGGHKTGRVGSIADRLVRKFPVSVLVVPPTFRGEYKTIAVASNFEEESDIALRRAFTLCNALGIDEVVVLHSYTVPAGYNAVCSWEEACSRIEAVAQDEAKEMIERVKKDEPDAPKIRVVIGEGPASTKIPAMASENNVDLLILSTHGRSGPAFMLLGQTTENILQHATCSVWAEKSPGLEQGILAAMKEIFK
jgi:nucleotide-binding universal stress UspA family protein